MKFSYLHIHTLELQLESQRFLLQPEHLYDPDFIEN